MKTYAQRSHATALVEDSQAPQALRSTRVRRDIALIDNMGSCNKAQGTQGQKGDKAEKTREGTEAQRGQQGDKEPKPHFHSI